MKRLVAILFNFMMGVMLATIIGAPAFVGGAVVTLCGLLFTQVTPAGSLMEGVFTEVWTGEMVKKFRNSDESVGWYSRIKAYDKYVENDVIHFTVLGGDPTVLVNNTTYPLGVEKLEDADKPIGLDKFQTKATEITDDELYGASYDKIGSVIERHEGAISDSKYKKAIHGLAPNENTTGTPVLTTSGPVVDGRKTLVRVDIIKLKKAYDKAKVPLKGRVLVLCPDHVNDLLNNDQKFADQYYKYDSGKILNMYGFDVYEFVETPYYNVTTLGKVAYGEDLTANDLQASVSFYDKRAMRADGSTKPYLSPASQDTQNQRNLCNFRHYSICLPLKGEGTGAIVSALPDAAPSILSAELIDAVPAAGATYNRTVSAPSAWAISTETSWLTVSTVSGKARIVVAPNTGEARSGSYLLSLVADPTVTLEVTVNQVAAE